MLTYWHDTVAFGHSLNYARVVKIGKARIRVRREGGEEVWKDPAFFDTKVSEREVADLIADGVRI